MTERKGSLTAWVVGSFLTIVLATATGFVSYAFAQQGRQEERIRTIEVAFARFQAQVEEASKHQNQMLERIEKKLDRHMEGKR